MGVAVGLVVLFVVRSAVSPAQFTLPRVQVAIGVLALLIAAVLAVWPAGTPSRWRPLLGVGPPARRRPLAVGAGGSGAWHRAAIGRLPCRAGGHRRLRRRARHADRRAADLQRGGIRVRRDPAARLPGGAGADAGVDDIAARLGPVAAQTRRRGPVGSRRMRAVGRRRSGSVDLASRLGLIVQHVLQAGEELRDRIGAAAEGGLRGRCGDGRGVIAVHRIHRDRSGQRIVVS